MYNVLDIYIGSTFTKFVTYGLYVSFIGNFPKKISIFGETVVPKWFLKKYIFKKSVW